MLDDSFAPIAEVNACEDFTAPMVLPIADMNAKIVKVVEHLVDRSSDNFDGRSKDLSDEIKIDIENNKDFEHAAIHSHLERACADDDQN